MLAATAFLSRAESADTRVYEMRTYWAPPGKLDELNARFRDHTLTLFAKHNITSIGYWMPIENPENKLIYVLSYASREAREAAWKEFNADPEWQEARAKSEANGKLVAKVEQRFLKATDFSPELKTGAGAGERVFELRTYTTTPNNLPALHARFRDYTMKLFTKSGMTNFVYWQLMPDQTGAENTLVYLLAHPSVDAAKKSWAAFRADPDWVAAKKASEDKAGGSLTLPDGVKSEYLKATDYSPTR